MLKENVFLPTGSTVAVQREDVRTYTHETITKHDDIDHSGRFHKIGIMKTGRVVPRASRHKKATSILPEQYTIQHQMSEQNAQYRDDDVYRQCEQNIMPSRVSTTNYECTHKVQNHKCKHNTSKSSQVLEN